MHTQTIFVRARRISQRSQRTIALLIVLLLAAVLLLPNLVSWPVSWYDEGFSLVVSENLALYGQYGVQSSEGFRLFDPLITTGPTVTVPIALVFEIFGIDLYYARLVMVLFALLTVTVFFLVVEHLFDLKVALVATIFLLVTPPNTGDDSASFLGLGRMVMGEVPALFFLFLGILLWFWALDRNSRSLLAVSGLAFGLAVITKGLDLLFIPALILLFIIDRFWHRQLKWTQFVIPIILCGVIAISWKGYQTILSDSGSQSFSRDSIERMLFLAIPTLRSPSLVIQNGKALFAAGILTWGIPGLIYGFYLSLRKDLEGVQRLFLVTIVIIWITWFVLGSIGWLRYALTAMVILNIFIAKLLVDLAGGFELSLADLVPRDFNREQTIKTARALAVSIAILFTFLVSMRQWSKLIIPGAERAQLMMASYIEDNVPEGSIIESNEMELVFLTDKTFHIPTHEVQAEIVAFVNYGSPYPEDFYDISRFNPDYVLRGPQAKASDFYLEVTDGNQYELEATYGPYDLYRSIHQSES